MRRHDPPWRGRLRESLARATATHVATTVGKFAELPNPGEDADFRRSAPHHRLFTRGVANNCERARKLYEVSARCKEILRKMRAR